MSSRSAPQPPSATATRPGRWSKFLGIFGGTSGGLGAFGAAHSVCHYTCQVIIGFLALAGISVAGMPFAFLLDPRLVALFSAVGLVSAGFGAVFQWKMRMKFDLKLAGFAALAVVSAVSLASGVLELTAGEGTPARGAPFSVDNETKSDKQGNVSMEIAFRGWQSDMLAFRIAMDSMKMDAPPLAEFDLAKLARLSGLGGEEITPVRWTVEEAGHMGHHLKGTLAFALQPAHRAVLERAPVPFEIVVRGVGGAGERRFRWITAPAGK